ncbi:MAG: GNAT family N-acetyltransferase [Erysipelotrichaceae bacterium]|nr:GNAT family N-acetyltransferase [Erysipelotrichaceae bacterium]MBQ7889799.1 GNAT family N-acetyltransferase [Erysipelotrichaceae bacterium]
MFFRKKIQKTDDVVILKELFRYKTREYGETVENIYFDIVSVQYNRKVGYCDLRMGMNPDLEILGQVGYHIEERYRGHHFAYRACVLLFESAKELGMEELLITCNPDNIPSRKTLEALGGTLKAIVDVPKENVCYQNGDRQKCIFTYHLS